MRCLFSHYWILWILLFLVQIQKIQSKFEFTNIKCENLDKEFCNFENCYLKSINRTYKYMSVKVNLYQLPVTQFSVRFNLLKRFSGYKPFLYDFTVGGCKLLAKQKSIPVANYFFGLIAPFSNLNRSCPVMSDVIFDKVPIDAMNFKLTKTLPFPEGDYFFNTSWIAYGKIRAIVQVFGSLS